MRIAISAIGKLKDAEERAIVERYAHRLTGAGKPLGLGPIDIREYPESRAPDVAEHTTRNRAGEARRSRTRVARHEMSGPRGEGTGFASLPHDPSISAGPRAFADSLSR